MKIRIKKVDPKAKIPERGREGDIGFDLFSVEEKTLAPKERDTFNTGLAFELPEGHALLIWDRSGLATGRGLTTLGGVVDPNFRGEVGVCLLNTSEKPHKVKRGDKIAQFLIQEVKDISFEESKNLSKTSRGENWAIKTGKINY